jgi:aminoglycoside phosphotransferase (APT) family kinase protein
VDDRQHLDRVARQLGIEAPTIQRLAGGSRNRCYRLTGQGIDVVTRIAGAGDADYAVARDTELLAQRLASSQGLAPSLLLEERGAGVTVMQFAPGRVWSRQYAASPDAAARLGTWLRRLHSIPVPPGMREVSFAANLEHYCAALERAGLAAAILDEARRIAHSHVPATQVAFCHNDLHHLNLVESPRGLLALDWEYAGAGDPVMDLAGYAAYHDLSEPALDALLDAYEVDGDSLARKAVPVARRLFEAVWWAWLEVHRHRGGEEPGGGSATRQLLARRILPPAC